MQNYTFLAPSILLKLQIKNDDKQHCIKIFIFSGFIYTLNINFPTVCRHHTKNQTHLMCNKQAAELIHNSSTVSKSHNMDICRTTKQNEFSCWWKDHIYRINNVQLVYCIRIVSGLTRYYSDVKHCYWVTLTYPNFEPNINHITNSENQKDFNQNAGCV
jgi:hypothetical protein